MMSLDIDTMLPKTFGMDKDTLIERLKTHNEYKLDSELANLSLALERKFEDVESVFFKPTIDFCSDGFSILLEPVDTTCICIPNIEALPYSKSVIADEILSHLDWHSFLKRIIGDSQKNKDSDPCSNEEFVVSWFFEAVKDVSTLKWIIGDHCQIVVDKLEEHGIEAQNFQNIEDLSLQLKAIIDEPLVVKVLDACINEDIENLDEQLSKIAEDHELIIVD